MGFDDLDNEWYLGYYLYSKAIEEENEIKKYNLLRNALMYYYKSKENAGEATDKEIDTVLDMMNQIKMNFAADLLEMKRNQDLHGAKTLIDELEKNCIDISEHLDKPTRR